MRLFKRKKKKPEPIRHDPRKGLETRPNPMVSETGERWTDDIEQR